FPEDPRDHARVFACTRSGTGARTSATGARAHLLTLAPRRRPGALAPARASRGGTRVAQGGQRRARSRTERAEARGAGEALTKTPFPSLPFLTEALAAQAGASVFSCAFSLASMPARRLPRGPGGGHVRAPRSPSPRPARPARSARRPPLRRER